MSINSELSVDENKTALKKPNNIKMTILFVLLTFPFFQISIIEDTISGAGKIYTLLQILAGLVIVLFFLKDRLLRKLPSLFLMFSGLLLVMIIGGIVNGGEAKRSLEYAFGTLMFCLVVEYGIQKDLRSFLKAGVMYFGSVTVVNLITVLLFPQGMYTYMKHYHQCWILGFKSGHITYHMAFLFFAAMYVILCDRKKWICFRAAVLLVFISNVLVQNRTASVVLIFLIFVQK